MQGLWVVKAKSTTFTAYRDQTGLHVSCRHSHSSCANQLLVRGIQPKKTQPPFFTHSFQRNLHHSHYFRYCFRYCHCFHYGLSCYYENVREQRASSSPPCCCAHVTALPSDVLPCLAHLHAQLLAYYPFHSCPLCLPLLPCCPASPPLALSPPAHCPLPLWMLAKQPCPCEWPQRQHVTEEQDRARGCHGETVWGLPPAPQPSLTEWQWTALRQRLLQCDPFLHPLRPPPCFCYEVLLASPPSSPPLTHLHWQTT